jgi:hypothetical protein
MTTMLRTVLNAFEHADRPRTVNQLARDLDIAPGMLEGMLAYWVRKGRLREANADLPCGSCGGADGCPFMLKLPRQYELVRPGETGTCATSPDRPRARCGCCG